ncbi:GNAT family N-acetyltransferase [Kitasatospora sp. RG8]|uniref:GNAT family N-acetyltransferase n=1 Tax=Kitasatospora sp. RG8 TaxID=2820815 RepID=UPI001AE00380|nr:GNAT family N-acetyltransferase [Kitasatospora sp. RG8]MBP0448635.1 GNAT family N-acetyltransferase [Kitasatospora sp. RG8]
MTDDTSPTTDAPLTGETSATAGTSPTANDLAFRRVADADWEAVVALEFAAYAADDLSEGRESLQARGRSSPDTCFVVELRGEVIGYVLSLPYPLYECPDLGSVEPAAPPADPPSRNLHIHDLVIAEEWRSKDVALRFMRHLKAYAQAQGFERISMVAVRRSDILLAMLGYRTHREVVVPECYGRRAVYMSLAI